MERKFKITTVWFLLILVGLNYSPLPRLARTRSSSLLEGEISPLGLVEARYLQSKSERPWCPMTSLRGILLTIVSYPRSTPWPKYGR